MALLPPHDMQSLAVHLYMRTALSFAPLALVAFALTLISRRRFARVTSVLTTFGAFFMYYVLLRAGVAYGQTGSLPAFAAWLPNVVFVVLSILLAPRVFSKKKGYAPPGGFHPD